MRKIRDYLRILKVAKKPTFTEYKTILKVTGIGVIIIGAIGFAVRMLANLIK
ncbi:MAG: protein translocase SEC61 complex subunit gamma [archaeon]